MLLLLLLLLLLMLLASYHCHLEIGNWADWISFCSQIMFFSSYLNFFETDFIRILVLQKSNNTNNFIAEIVQPNLT